MTEPINNSINAVLYDVKKDDIASNPIVLHVFDTNFNRQGIIENYITMVWEEEYQGKGAFTLVCVDSPENIALLKQDWYIYRKEKQTAMVIKHLKFDSKNRQIVVHGYTTLYLLQKRIVYPTVSVSNVETGMYKLVNDNNRGMPYLENAPLKKLTATFDTQFTFKYVLECLEDLAREADYGFFMKFDHRNKKHIFTVYQGTDRTYGNATNPPVVFSQEFKNLNNLVIVDDMTDFRNVAYVGGEGEGANRLVIKVNDNITGLNRCELPVDARDLQREQLAEPEYTQLLRARGIRALNEHNRKQSFLADVDPSRFGIDFFLGDKTTDTSKKYNIKIDVRIMQYAEIRENNETKLRLTLGIPEINPFKR